MSAAPILPSDREADACDCPACRDDREWRRRIAAPPRGPVQDEGASCAPLDAAAMAAIEGRA